MEQGALWRQEAADLFPDLRAELGETDSDTVPIENIYFLFFELLPRCFEATGAGDEETLVKIYAFAEWCSQQEEKDLWNAAGVCFYEHLVDEPQTLVQIPQRLSPAIFAQVSGLLEWRLGKAAFAALQAEFARVNDTY